jgi:hypothetical protein
LSLNEQDGIQRQITQKIDEKDISWMPIMKAISLSTQENKQDINDIIKKNFKKVEKMIKAITKA